MLNVTFTIEGRHESDQRDGTSWDLPVTAKQVADEIRSAMSAMPDTEFTLTSATTNKLVFTGVKSTVR